MIRNTLKHFLIYKLCLVMREFVNRIKGWVPHENFHGKLSPLVIEIRFFPCVGNNLDKNFDENIT